MPLSKHDQIGILYIVALPIGNLDDISPRVIRILSQVDLIACEDTRVTGLVLKNLNISKKMISYYEHVEDHKSAIVIDLLESGASVALVSDAGTPLISDPGYVLVRKARAAGLPVIPIPGPSSVISALSVSGMATNNFFFAGFLPRKDFEIICELEKWRSIGSTVVFFESAKRLHGTLPIIRNCLGNRAILIAREMTKTYEEFISGTLDQVIQDLPSVIKGEIVCVLEGIIPVAEDIDPRYISLAKRLIELGLSRKDIVALLSEEFDVSKNDLKKILNQYQ